MTCSSTCQAPTHAAECHAHYMCGRVMCGRCRCSNCHRQQPLISFTRKVDVISMTVPRASSATHDVQADGVPCRESRLHSFEKNVTHGGPAKEADTLFNMSHKLTLMTIHSFTTALIVSGASFSSDSSSEASDVAAPTVAEQLTKWVLFNVKSPTRCCTCF